jgi:two-component system cell cycle response regulator
MKHSKSILFLLSFLFIILLINSFFVIYLIQNNEIKNAYFINELGQIRGGMQKYVKLKLINKDLEKIKTTESYIDTKFKDIYSIFKDIIPTESTEFFEKNFLELDKNWQILKKENNLSKIYELSEKSWNIADSLVIYTAKAIESKTQKILFLIILISIVTILSTLIMLFIIYTVISKNLRIKTLKDPFSKLYNTYHLNETLELLQNRYQRYGKTFALIKIVLQKPNETNLKKISSILKNNIRRSDKIFYSKKSIIIITLEPEKINLKEYSKRVENLIKNITSIKNSEFKTFNGQKIEEFI